MKNRVIAGVAVLAVVLALVGLAVVAGRDSGSKEPATLPVLGAGGGAEKMSASPGVADSSMRIAPTRYEAGKLPGLADEADAWKLEARSDEGAVAELAKVLGVDGDVTKTDSGWTVGTDTRRLDVQAVAGMPWSLYENIPVSSPAIECIKAPCEVDGSSGSSGSGTATATTPACPPNADCATTSVAPVPPDDPAACAADACDQPMEARRPADLPTKAEAEQQARALLEKLGVDLDNADVRVDDGITVWNVLADPIVGGLPTIGFSTSVSVGPKGEVQYANGWLGEPTKGDRYPLIGTAAALKRLNDEQARIMIAPAPDVRCEDCLVDPAAPSAEPRVVRVTGVRLGLQLFSTYEPGAAAYLVPSYLFAIEDGGELPVIAVADQYLGKPPTPAEPEPEPGTPAEPDVNYGGCSASSSAVSPGEEQAAEVQICGPDRAKVGEAVTFSVVAKGKVRDDCASPGIVFGDEGPNGTARCLIGCESLPDEPREVTRKVEHTYTSPGTYTARVVLEGCGADADQPQATAEVTVRVEG